MMGIVRKEAALSAEQHPHHPLLIDLGLGSDSVTVCISGGDPGQWTFLIRTFMSFVGLEPMLYDGIVHPDPMATESRPGAFIKLQYRRHQAENNISDDSIKDELGGLLEQLEPGQKLGRY
jgi:hypothetical protein